METESPVNACSCERMTTVEQLSEKWARLKTDVHLLTSNHIVHNRSSHNQLADRRVSNIRLATVVTRRKEDPQEVQKFL